MTASSGARTALVAHPLYAIVDAELCASAGRAPLDVARAMIAGGARVIQVRAKTWESGALADLCLAVAETARDAGALTIVNDRADIAVIASASGVHVGQEDLAPRHARRIVGAGAVVGVSTHTDAQVRAALGDEVSYLAIGPVFATSTKRTGYDAVGLAMVRHAAGLAGARGLPVVAIGGITLETARSVVEAGAAAVAVIGDLMDGDPEVRVRAYLRALA